MNDAECIGFLQWVLPRLRMRWPGFRRVRRQVCKRIGRRLVALGLPSVADYRRHLEDHEAEWAVLDAMCAITISRFYRDPAVFEFLGNQVFPEIARSARARGDDVVRCWSAGCASGEEPYSLALRWSLTMTHMELEILASDTDAGVLRRAREACFAASSLRDVPRPLREAAFVRQGDTYLLEPEHRHRVKFVKHDVRTGAPDGPFDLIACRNLVFTYYQPELQLEVAQRMHGALHEGGALVLGIHEALPAGARGFLPWSERLRVYRGGPT